MAFEAKLSNIPGVIASGDLSASQFKFVTIGTSGAALNTTAGGFVAGVLQDKPTAAGQAASVANTGVSKVVAGDTVAVGDELRSDTSGRAVPNAGSGTAPGYFTRGFALTAGAADEIITMALAPTSWKTA